VESKTAAMFVIEMRNNFFVFSAAFAEDFAACSALKIGIEKRNTKRG